MSESYQQLLKQWAALSPDECSTTERDYRFKVKVLLCVEKRSFETPWRSITSENLVLIQLNFVLLTVLHHCFARQSSISFTFSDQGTNATICNGLKSQIYPHPAIAALDAYIQLLNF
ncbi:hypothetical protein [Nostoc sp. MG11]|uniref:hypothetical protein n=1 Tax=Nostoc sp. MG11 TaxID=2721166 RepID=UPI0018668488|nr:hypothetical protein [Nostoc sp. MG11]